jgi:hypothetical protein
MELSEEDIAQLVRAGYRPREFTVAGEDGVTRLRNIGGWCYFYDVPERRCRAYRDRPIGCRLYPVVYLTDNGTVTVDRLCPMVGTISKRELKAKGRVLLRLLKTLDDEARAK